MFRNGLLSALLVMLSVVGALAQQEVKLHGYFIEDSIKIGLSTPYVLTARYPKKLDLVFPDSLYDYTPYELEEKLYFATKSDSVYSYDSAVYYITSFEIDTVQYFQLPVFIIKGKDSTRLSPLPDSIFLQQMVAEIPDSVAVEAMPLIENTNYRKVDLQFNYPYFLIALGILVVAAIIIFLVFGKKIRIWFVLRRMNKRHAQFIIDFERLLKETDTNKYEHLVILWKGYLQKLEKQPYLSFTTRELLQYQSMQEIETILKKIDRAIYGKVNGIEVAELDQLKNYTQKRFDEKVKEVKHG